MQYGTSCYFAKNLYSMHVACFSINIEYEHNLFYIEIGPGRDYNWLAPLPMYMYCLQKGSGSSGLQTFCKKNYGLNGLVLIAQKWGSRSIL